MHSFPIDRRWGAARAQSGLDWRWLSLPLLSELPPLRRCAMHIVQCAMHRGVRMTSWCAHAPDTTSVQVHPSGGFLAVSNHGLPPGVTEGVSGSVAIISIHESSGALLKQTCWVPHTIDANDPSLGQPGRTDWTTHAHSANWSVCGKWLFGTLNSPLLWCRMSSELNQSYVAACGGMQFAKRGSIG